MALNDTVFPSRYFAPYVDVSLFPPFPLARTAQDIGTKFYTLAFIVDSGGCTAAWGGTTPLGDQNLLSDLSNLRSLGGDVIVSFGGANGRELAQACGDVSSLQPQYQTVIDMYNLTHIDFDIEGTAVGEPTSLDRRNKAIAGLQAAAQRAGKQLLVSYTLPVDPSGLDFHGLNVLQNAIQNGVNVNVVNIMTMD